MYTNAINQNIIKGDPFSRIIRVRDNTANANVNLSSGWTANVSLHRSLVANTVYLSGLNSDISTGNLIISANSLSTNSYPEGTSYISYKIKKTDDTVILRGEIKITISKGFV